MAFSKDTISDYDKVLKYPKDAAFAFPGSDKTQVWVRDGSNFGFTAAEVVSSGETTKVKLESGEVCSPLLVHAPPSSDW